ncbi:MAG: hypothetical protein AAFX10_04820, partial [Pseudomonadota bacterium]
RGALWTRLARDLFPHPGVDEATYRSVAAQLQGMAAGPGLRDLFDEGLRRLGEDWHCRPEPQRLQALRGVQTTPFFRTTRTIIASLLYSRPAVWRLIGYEGPSLEHGGYLGRGFDDIGWLEAPAT